MKKTKIQHGLKYQKKYILDYHSNPIEKISSSIYNDFIYNFNNIEYLKQQVILAPKNRTVDDINKHILSLISLIPREQKSYYRYDTVIPSYGNIDELNILYPQEILHTLNFNGIPPHKLNLKVGIPIILLQNLNQLIGLFSGTRLIITQLRNKIIEGQIINSNNINEKVYIPIIEITIHESKWPFTMKKTIISNKSFLCHDNKQKSRSITK